MYIKIRTVDGKNAVIPVSKSYQIKEIKIKIREALGIEPERQCLFYRGKQLVDDHSVFDYNLNINDVVQLLERNVDPGQRVPTTEKSDCDLHVNTKEIEKELGENNRENEINISDSSHSIMSSNTLETNDIKSEYFRVGDFVDVVDVNCGTWLEGKIMYISNSMGEASDNSDNITDGLIYSVLLDSNDLIDAVIYNIRPRAKHLIKCANLKVGDNILANYNLDKPNERGHWYECTVSKLGKISRTAAEVYVDISALNKILIKDAKLKFFQEIFKLEERHFLTEVDVQEYQTPIPKRKSVPTCISCRDRPQVKCKECGCQICGMKTEPEKQILCDECNMAYHFQCLDPPLDVAPSEVEWYCPDCKNDESEIVKPGEKLKKSKKKEKMASSTNASSRDWGKGMACVGRTKECTLVPPNHYGPIPGIEVGTCWKFRLQVSEVGVHRPLVAGIHGRESDGAYSIVLSSGYEDDVDNGETFLYTGSGGRKWSGDKRITEQSCDQSLTRMNKALALNCSAPLSDKGAKAEAWKNGKPIRVVRNYKAAKHSEYAPVDGNRYDGIYKIVEYYPQKGKSGFIVWRYLLRRDDSAPPPWTQEGKARIEKLGLKMVYPEGYLEAEAAKAALEANNKESKRGKKRVSETLPPSEAKHVKITEFNLEKDVLQLIEKDKGNGKLWNSCKRVMKDGKQKFLTLVTDTFICICCQELVYKPVSTKCKHNFCLQCLKHSFIAGVYSCPTCRADLGKNFEMKVNKYLSACLLNLFPGYDVGR